MKVLVTRPQAQSAAFAAALSQAGFTPVFFPVIEIRPADDFTSLDRALGRLSCYDWIVFTSVNAVDVVLDRRAAEGLAQAQAAGTTRVAAIGPQTAKALETRGITPDFIPYEYIAEAILPGLGDLRGSWVLLPRAEIAREALPNAISLAGGVAHVIAVYHTLPVQPDEVGLRHLRQGVDWLTFTSPSTVTNFCTILRQQGLDPLNLPGAARVACIGPITTRAAQEAGFRVAVTAEEYTSAGLVQALIAVQPGAIEHHVYSVPDQK